MNMNINLFHCSLAAERYFVRICYRTICMYLGVSSSLYMVLRFTAILKKNMHEYEYKLIAAERYFVRICYCTIIKTAINPTLD